MQLQQKKRIGLVILLAFLLSALVAGIVSRDGKSSPCIEASTPDQRTLSSGSGSSAGVSYDNVPKGDTDCDGVPDVDDLCVFVFDPAQHDRDSDGYGDACE